MQRDLDRQPYFLEVDSQRVGRRVTVEDGSHPGRQFSLGRILQQVTFTFGDLLFAASARLQDVPVKIVQAAEHAAIVFFSLLCRSSQTPPDKFCLCSSLSRHGERDFSPAA